jgi:hypothetical protein
MTFSQQYSLGVIGYGPAHNIQGRVHNAHLGTDAVIYPGIVKFTAQRKTTFYSAGTSPGSEALTSRVGRDNGLELTQTSHATTLW